jgi:hypothetical protein
LSDRAEFTRTSAMQHDDLARREPSWARTRVAKVSQRTDTIGMLPQRKSVAGILLMVIWSDT